MKLSLQASSSIGGLEISREIRRSPKIGVPPEIFSQKQTDADRVVISPLMFFHAAITKNMFETRRCPRNLRIRRILENEAPV
eukprot:3773202-Pyramimonas_sp.AAC.1